VFEDKLKRLPVVFVRTHYLMVVECEGMNYYACWPHVTAFFQVAVLDGSRRMPLYGRECHGSLGEVCMKWLGMREGRGLGGSFDLKVKTFLDAIPLHLTPFFDGRIYRGQVGAAFLRDYANELIGQRCVIVTDNGLRPAE
jgi:hypothetical protein